MRLTWNEIRARAAVFADEWQNAHYEKGETQSFYNAFFRIFGIERRKVATFEESVARTGRAKGFIDLFWPRTLIVEQKSKGRDLFKARQQAVDYLHDIPDADMPRFILVSDFQTFELTDLETRERTAFVLADLPKHVEKFGFMLGITKRNFKDQDPVNIKAAELVGTLHDEIKASGYAGHKLEQFLVRTVFCLFADDTGIFQPKDILWDYLENRTAPDGSDTGPLLNKLFEVLNTPEDARSATLDEDLTQFPYVNGALFAEYFPSPDFNASMRTALVNACRFDWTPISPAIFGSLFQSVMDPVERREKGAHYTTEKNILKVIEPLFMDDLRAEFTHLKGLKRDKRRKLEAFQNRLKSLTFFDPACGCGNFLIIAYRELRLLELDIMRELKTIGQLALLQSAIDVDQFYGIEFEEFPAKIAETALWMMDHIMNTRLSLEFGEVYTRIPLVKSPTIVYGDALETDWATVLPPEKCSFILGNPPFVGHHLQSAFKKEQLRRTYGPQVKSAGVMDFVTAWFVKAAQYVQVSQTLCAFVATNSISQGEQVGILWRALEPYGLTINFAHRTFKWESEARGKAAVYCVIIGFSKEPAQSKRLYDYQTVTSEPEMREVEFLNAYLIEAPWVLIDNISKNPSGMPEMMYGSKPTDGGNFILSHDERTILLQKEPEAERFIRRFISAKEYFQNDHRWVVWLVDAEPYEIRSLPNIYNIVKAVGKFRSESKAASTRNYRHNHLFRQVTQPQSDYILVPRVSSERREYIPLGFFNKDDIVSDTCLAIPGANIAQFGLLHSKMHMAWVNAVSGRLKSDYRYSKDIVYNTFPLPKGDLTKLDPLAQAILDARANHPGATLADLYDPDLMPADLRRAHTALDRAVDKMYRRSGFASDRERVEHLFALYEQMMKPLLAKKPRRGRR